MIAAEGMAPGFGAERARIVDAVIDVVTEGGGGRLMLASVLKYTGLDEKAFLCHFAGLEDCYLEIANEMNDEFVQRAAAAFASEKEWLGQLRATGYAMLEFIVEEPRRARFMFVGTLCFGERAQLLRDQTVALFAELLDQGRGELDDPDMLSRATADAMAGAIYHQLHTHIARGDADDPAVFTELSRQLMYTAVRPYIGPAAAMDELRRPWPVPPGRTHGYPASVPEEELGPLPAGRHGLSREQVAHNQRERLIAGFAHAVAERGYNETTIAHITKAASVSRRVFYENFEGKEQCFLAAFDIVIGHLHELMDEAAETVSDWPHRVVAELAALLRFYASEPELARLTLVEALAAGPVVAQRYRDGLLSFAPRLEPGRALRAADRPLPDSREGSLLGGLASLLSRQVASGQTEQLPDLLPDLTEFLLTPYLGPDEAERLAGEVA
jgi:AcrR family transcriptional regulator